jgi:spore germination protein KB
MAYLVATGIENFGRSVMFPLTIVVLTIFGTLLLSFGEVDMNNFLPMFSHSVRDYTQGTFNSITFPLAETVLLLPLFDSVKKEDSPYKIYTLGILLGSLVLLVILFRNIGLLGSHTLQTTVFPSYRAARLLTFSSTLERIETLVTYNFVFTGIAKIAVCLFAATKGTAKLFGLGNYRQILFPVCLLVVAVGMIVFKDPSEIISFYNVSPYFFIIFQVPIPIIIWIGCEIKSRRRKKTSYI